MVAAGLSAVLALTPVAAPASMAFADDQGAVQEQKGAGQEAEAENIVICNKKHFTVNFHNADGNLIDTVEGDAAFSLSNIAVLSPVKDYVNQLVSAHPEYSDASWTMFEPGSSNATPMDVENAKFGGTQPDYVNGGVGYYEINIYEFVSTPEKSTVTVSFDMNYPEGATGTSENYSVESSESGYITAPSDPACEGYEFLGWARNGNTAIPLLTSQAVDYQ